MVIKKKKKSYVNYNNKHMNFIKDLWFNISNPVVKMLLHNFNKIAILQIIYVVECFYFLSVET